MTMTDTIPQDPLPADAVRRVQCGHCWAPLAGEPCTPEGSHLARWARASRRGLISREQLAAAIRLLDVIHDGAIVPDVTP
jgi:hypothetical protein